MLCSSPFKLSSRARHASATGFPGSLLGTYALIGVTCAASSPSESAPPSWLACPLFTTPSPVTAGPLFSLPALTPSCPRRRPPPALRSAARGWRSRACWRGEREEGEEERRARAAPSRAGEGGEEAKDRADSRVQGRGVLGPEKATCMRGVEGGVGRAVLGRRAGWRGGVGLGCEGCLSEELSEDRRSTLLWDGVGRGRIASSVMSRWVGDMSRGVRAMSRWVGHAPTCDSPVTGPGSSK